METTEDKTYNGWKNYETWCVQLWMNNDSCNQANCREMAAEARAEAADVTLRNKYWSEAEHARFTLADNLKSEFEENNPLADQATVWGDLLGAALSEVNWHEIADSFLSME